MFIVDLMKRVANSDLSSRTYHEIRQSRLTSELSALFTRRAFMMPIVDPRVVDATGYEHHEDAEVLLAHDLSSVDGIAAASSALAKRLAPFVVPSAHGSGTLAVGGSVTVDVFNLAGHDFPALLLAALCGYRAGTQVVMLSVLQLQLAVSLMAPAERCRAFKHPNIAAWRKILARVAENPDERPIAVFFDARQPSEDRIVASFLRHA
jgi:hypothetical protein